MKTKEKINKVGRTKYFRTRYSFFHCLYKSRCKATLLSDDKLRHIPKKFSQEDSFSKAFCCPGYKSHCKLDFQEGTTPILRWS